MDAAVGAPIPGSLVPLALVHIATATAMFVVSAPK